MKIISICAFRIWYEWNLHLPQKICFDIATLVSKLELLVPHNTGHRVVCLQDFRLFRKGPFIKDVRTKGGGGVSPKADIVREVAWIYSYRSSQNADKGGRGSKILNILRTSFMNGPKGGFH